LQAASQANDEKYQWPKLKPTDKSRMPGKYSKGNKITTKVQMG